VVIAGVTNASVTARGVGPALPPGYHQVVLFSKDTQEALLASGSKERVCFLSGRFFRVDAGERELYVTPSAPLGTNVFTAQAALDFGKRAFVYEPGDPGPYMFNDGPYRHMAGISPLARYRDAFLKRCGSARGAGGPGALVDVWPLLAGRGIPQVSSNECLLSDVTIKPQGTNLLVNFEICRGEKPFTGTVLLDQKLNVLSKALDETAK
jgi:hypothetical protein